MHPHPDQVKLPDDASVDASDIARAWRLEPHPEGGFYRETFRSQTTIELPGWPGERSLATAIIYLLAAGDRSARHRVRGDELWLWQGGGPMELTVGGTERLLTGEPPATGFTSRACARHAHGTWQDVD